MLTAKLCLYRAVRKPEERWTWFFKLDDGDFIMHPDRLYAKRESAEQAMRRWEKKLGVVVKGVIPEELEGVL